MDLKPRTKKAYPPYLETIVIEVIAGLFRFVPIFLFVFVIVWVTTFWRYQASYNFGILGFNTAGVITVSTFLSVVISYFNILLSFGAKLGLGSGRSWTRFALGARDASTRELEQINQFLSQVAAEAKNRKVTVNTFTALYVLDSPMAYANVIGSTLYISSGAFGSRHFQALVVHDLAHLHQGVGVEVLSLRRLVSPFFQFFVGDIKNFSTNPTDPRPEIREFDAIAIYFTMVNKFVFFVFALFGGGLGVYMLSPLWASYFRQCDYEADAFAAKLGYKDVILELLEETKFYDTAVPYMRSWSPANELRIDALLHPALYGLPSHASKEAAPTTNQPSKTTAKLQSLPQAAAVTTVRVDSPSAEETESEAALASNLIKKEIPISLSLAYSGGVYEYKEDDKVLYSLHIPEGVADGDVIAQIDDKDKLYHFTAVVSDKEAGFTRMGDDLYLHHVIDPVMAEVGGQIQIEALDSKNIILKIPPETKSGTTLKYIYYGMPLKGNDKEYGDLQLVVTVRENSTGTEGADSKKV